MSQYKPTTTGKVSFGEWETAYEVYGTLPAAPGKVPLIGLHGGPGMPGRYLRPLSVLVEAHGIPVILYDQIGCGDSTHLPEKGGDFWTVELFLKELENLLEKLEIKEYDLLGTSWGAILAAEHALLHPHGLRKLILSNGLTSMKMWEDSVISLLKTMPQDVQDTIEKHEKERNYNAPEYRAACKVFYDAHLCRIIPTPPELVEAYTLMMDDPTVSYIMSGPSEFHSLGTLKTWNIISRLGEITTPTLVLNGKYDMTSDTVVKPFLDGIKGSKWVRFEHSSHAPMLEEREKYAEVVGEFLTE
ncbi:proline-specific peptidase [Calocera viscosa TUFC12733]|uniref:Proline-specific peptidase n=1 Tax=Calocera viscosa (strain TUFC12733) TaxID=1330018 RepID=A0A167KUD8_CALVF|nr:proline-specific peptidase [Calocera viscosa TUFC12733]